MAFCQENLISNGDLEEYWECPYQQNDAPIRSTHWYRASYSSSDYFNVCSSPSDNGCTVLCATVPQNTIGFQVPRSGNGYCGFGAYTRIPQGIQYKEYIGSRLEQSLVPGAKYVLSFFVSLADSCAYATDQIGCHLSEDSLDIPAMGPSFVTPLINNSNGILSDKVNWVEITDTFVATGLEKYITIGSFGGYDEMQLELQPTYGDTVLNSDFSSAYYYVDDISLFKVLSESDLPNVLTPNNDNVNESVHFGAYISGIDQLIIVNRWGEVVHEGGKGANLSWSGLNWKSGKECVDGVYFYIVSTPGKQISGTVHLFR